MKTTRSRTVTTRTRNLLLCVAGVVIWAATSSAFGIVITADVGDWMREDQPTANNNLLDLFVGSVGSSNSLRGVAVFDLTGFSTTHTINDATVSVFHNTADFANHKPGPATDTDVSIHLAGQTPTNAVTWHTYDGSNAWSTPGGDFGAALGTTSANVETIGLGDEVAFNSASLTAAIQTAVTSGDSSIGFILTAPGLEAAGVRDFFAFQGDGRTGPNLNVDFSEPGIIRFQESVSPSGGYTVPDTFIRADNPTGNFESHSQIIAGSNATWGPLRGMLQFDLTELANLNPASIDSVELTMHYTSNGTSNSLTLDLYSTQAFDAMAATWNDPDGDGDDTNDTDGGSLDSLLSSVTFDPTDASGDYTFADSEAFRTSVDNALAGDNTLYLLMLDQSENTAGQSFVRFDSADTGAATFYPELVINYTEAAAVPEPSTFALAALGLLGLGLVGWRRKRAA